MAKKKEVPASRPPKTFTVEIVVENNRGARALHLVRETTDLVHLTAKRLTIADLAAALRRASEKASADPVPARPKDKILWFCRTHDFTIDFGADSPFNPNAIRFTSEGKKTKVRAVKKNSTPGKTERYYYAVSVVDGRTLITLDPEVIIDESAP